VKEIWKTLVELFDVMPAGARGFYVRYSILTSFLAVLDVAALALIAMLLSPLANGGPIKLPIIGEISDSMIVWIILLICALFIVKSVLALGLHWQATRRFAAYELEVGNRLFRAFTHSTWEERAKLSTAEITRIIDGSMSNTNIGFILPISQLPNNGVTFLAMIAVLLVTQPVAALIAVLYLGVVVFFMMMFVTKKAKQAGRVNRQYGYKTARLMTEMMEAIKEVTLRNRLNDIGEVVSQNRRVATRARANVAFLGAIPRYSLEAALIGGFVLIGTAMFFVSGLGGATAAVALFAATGFRMLPALTNAQTGFTNASSNMHFARDIVAQLKRVEEEEKHWVNEVDAVEFPEEPEKLELAEVTFRYPGADYDVLHGISLNVPFGKRLAVVGPSGAGKSTLIDVLLGLSTPTGGSITVDGTELRECKFQWRSRVGYVPQRVALFNGSIAQNVALTWGDEYDEEKVIQALERAQLGELVHDRKGGIHELIGERGVSISGGQQQRLGIARALYSDPLVLVFDEATSSLDTNTEHLVTKAMEELAGDVTFITIAHRLSTIRDYDTIAYLDGGNVQGLGTFSEVVEQVDDFKRQAQLAGLVEIN
jgi:ABC-type multidrug transport system fused ATPase/permease subunit